jgi:SAM-dependent methyltransferase
MAMRARRSFSQKNLEFRQEGPLGDVLAEALRVPERSGYVLTHRFHPYPGRFHPHLARTLLRAAAGEGESVFDPFMGGGTTLVEAILRGLPAAGNDLNPIARLVARERTRPRTGAQAERVTGEVQRIAALVEGLRKEKRPPRVRLTHLARLTPYYQQHLLAELMQWIRLIRELRPGAEKETLQAVFSSGAVKFSNQSSDSRTDGAPPRYPKGAATRFFVAKCTELARSQMALAHHLPCPARVELYQEDAALLPSLGWGAFDLVLSSPPYPGTYDYYDQHRLRIDWLELEGEPFHSGELGARRDTRRGSWSHGLRDVMLSLARVLKPGGGLFLVMGDWLDDTHAVDAGEALRRIAGQKGWRVSSSAAVRRAVFSHKEKKAYAKRGKWEHLIHLVR